jgi:hypothetical protein
VGYNQSRSGGPASWKRGVERAAEVVIGRERNEMTTVPTFAPPKPLTDLDIVTAFARKTAQTGEEPRIHNLWDNRYRINFYLRNENRIGRSLLVTLSGDKIEISKVQ